ncbi:MAG TPA: DUF3108 domain-containing protein [Burkholderiales bacterium]|nr:DUF3108 domain-containing protein [Burkholderiales bacterium]
MRRGLLYFLAVFMSAAAATPPAYIEIEFELTRNGGAMAQVTERLERSGDEYQLTETWKGRGFYALLGSARRVSRGSLTASALRPREFFDERSGRDTARAWFDWQTQQVTMQYKGERKTEPMFPDTQDRLSFLVALSLLPGRAQSASFHIVDGKGLSHHKYQVLGRERLKTPAGEFDTVKVARLSEGERQETAELWLAAELGYLPVRLLVVQDDGTRLDQTAVRVSREPQP